MWNRRLAALLLSIAVLASACGGGDRDVLATANGGDITTDDLALAIQFSRANSGQTGPVDLGDREAAQLITNLILMAVIRGPLAEEGIDLPKLIGISDANEVQVVNAALGELAEKRLGLSDPARRQELGAQLMAELGPFERPLCSSHILVEDLETANTVIARLDAGESFEDLAEELSIDPGSATRGGTLGCRPPNLFVPEFAGGLLELDTGEVSGPVQSTFGFHIIRLEEDAPDIADSLLVEARDREINTWIVETFDTAVVELDPVVGVWNGTGIIPANFVTP